MSFLTRLTEQLGQADPVILLAGVVGGLLLLLIGRAFFKSNYVYALFILCLVLETAASRFPLIRDIAKSFLRWAMLALMAGLAILPVRRTPTSGKHPGVLACMFLFVVLTFVSSLYSVWLRYSLERAISFAILAVAVYVGVYRNACLPERLREMMDMFFLLALIICGITVVTIVFPVGEGTRLSGFFGNPNALGMFCAIFLPIVIWQYWERTRRKMRWRLVALALSIVMVVVIFMSGSRGSTIGAFLMCGFLLTVLWGAKAAVPVVSLGILGVAGILASRGAQAFLSEKTAHLVRAERLGTLTHRTELWARAWPYILDKPFFGSGFGVSRYIFYGDQVDLNQLSVADVYYTTLHSMHIQAAVDLGIVGVSFLWLMIGYIFAVGAKTAMHKDNTSERGMTAALFAACAVVAMDTVIHGWLYSAGSTAAIFHAMFVCMLQAGAQWDLTRRGGAPRGPAASSGNE